MKQSIQISLYVLLSVYFIIVLISCNPLTGDNKVSQIDSAPKPQLASLSLRTDVPPTYTNSFTGSFQLIEKNLFDTTTYQLFIDNNFVRADKYNGGKNYESLIINLTDKEMIILNHQKKLYSTLKVKEEKMEFDSTIKIIKTENEKTILGKKCKQWRVKNIAEKTEVTYWVDSSNYGFYYYLIKLWNSTQKTHKYFQIVPNSFNCMPLEIVERNLLRDVKCSINITKIDSNKVDENLFAIPKDYSPFSI